MSLGVSLAAAWAVTTSWGPGLASLDWDKYHLISSDTRTQTFNQIKSVDSRLTYSELEQLPTTEAMIYQLKQVLSKSPHSARAHIRLAGLYLRAFEEKQFASQNAMSVAQIRAAAIASNFQSANQLRDWLSAAFGNESNLLYRAYIHTCQGLRLGPLQAEGYLHMANLCFLQGRGDSTVRTMVDQAASLRPHEGNILLEVGRYHLVEGQEQLALDAWKEAYHSDGPSRLPIIRLLAGRIPAQSFIEYFQPDWHSLDQVWETYKKAGTAADLQVLVEYSQSVARQDSGKHSPAAQGRIWLALSKMQQSVDDPASALVSLNTAHQIVPDDYAVRRELGRALPLVGRHAEALEHLKWCLARRPEDKYLRHAYVAAAQQANYLQATAGSRNTNLK